MSQASSKTTFTEWSNIPWAKVRRKVFKLQKAIYQAVKSENKAKARRLQKILHKSYYACGSFLAGTLTSSKAC